MIRGGVMSTAAGKTRITITLGDEVLAMLDKACAKSGQTRSAEIANALIDALDPPTTTTPEQMIALLQDVIRQRDSR